VTGNEGQPLALFAAASINEPAGKESDKVSFENNTFNVCFVLK
jgi:hypothetical protein